MLCAYLVDGRPAGQRRFLQERGGRRSTACARRTAELFELLGYEDDAVICWRFARVSQFVVKRSSRSGA
ncbi:hypothetical protein ABGB16_25980 [Micromonospora sp. B11E3]|uniref:hypothetical protein n=1 Tax=Micromonospora sp. B11E3 TaxID=3153562 RepID=UPI00325EA6C6